MISCMNASETSIEPAPPNVLGALRRGFDVIANHAGLLLFPLGLDLLLWLGPRLRVQSLMAQLLSWVASATGLSMAQVVGLPADSRLTVSVVLERLNLAAVLRTYPVGIPSLMAGSLPMEAPLGQPPIWEVPSWWAVAGLWALLTLIGLALGIFYYQVVAQAALQGKVHLKEALAQWPLATLNIVVLALIVIAFLLVVSIPFSCAFSMLPAGGLQFGGLLYIGLAAWMLFPLFFTPHGVLGMRNNLLTAVRRSERLTRLSFPQTVLLVVLALASSQLMDLLWRVPEETSWLMLVGIAGHAFVATSLLAATFIYYRDADHWAEDTARKLRLKALG